MAAGSTPDHGLLLELVQRLLLHPYPEGPTSVDVYPGRVPDDRSIDLPIPSGGRLLGTAVHRRGRDLTTVEAVIDVATRVAVTIGAYEEELRRRGWGLSDAFGGGGGFVPSAGPWRAYRRGRSGPVLKVNAYERGDDATDLRLRLDWQMARHMQPRPHHPEVMHMMPSLAAPADVKVEGGGGGGSESHWSSHGTAHTKMPVAELEAYFAEQLARAGWARLAGSAQASAAWSAWSVPGRGKWFGLLLVLAFDSDDRSLSVHIHGPGRPSRGWSRATSILLRR